MSTKTQIVLEDQIKRTSRSVDADTLTEDWRNIVIDGVSHIVARWVMSGSGSFRRLTAYDAHGSLIETRVGTKLASY